MLKHASVAAAAILMVASAGADPVLTAPQGLKLTGFDCKVVVAKMQFHYFSHKVEITNRGTTAVPAGTVIEWKVFSMGGDLSKRQIYTLTAPLAPKVGVTPPDSGFGSLPGSTCTAELFKPPVIK